MAAACVLWRLIKGPKCRFHKGVQCIEDNQQLGQKITSSSFMILMPTRPLLCSYIVASDLLYSHPTSLNQ